MTLPVRITIRHLATGRIATRRLAALVLAAVAGIGAAVPAQAQRVIRIVVPFGPGAVQDAVARTFSNEMAQVLGASVVIENRAGAGGTIGAAAVAKAPPDGNTLILAGSSHHIAGHMYRQLPFDPLKDFTAVTFLGTAGYVITAPPNLGVATLAEFVREVKSRPGKLNFASAGNGSATHLGMAAFNARAGLEMQHIPMKSTGDAVNEVLAGRVQAVAAATAGIVAFKGDARVRMLAFTGKARSQFLPEVPTVAEAGFPGFQYEAWVGMLAPSGTPRAEVERLNAAAQKALALPAVQERLNRLGSEYAPMSVDAFQALLRADWETMGNIVRISGAKVE
ncbi:MAG: tripartite tricarboxylate transporter substrate binding protein [Burkholderiales bacterium]|nr:tripartite tricarboxylate transporter substrate binding protein [Burkholderiales bacterium]